MKTMLLALLLTVGGFILGSVMFSKIIPMYFLHKDICAEHDDKNPGAANVFLSCGPVWGVVCLVLDMLKGALPVLAACRFLRPDSILFATVILAPVLGHALALFSGMRGGKCIATLFGVLVGLLPVTRVVFILCALYIFFSVIIKIDPIRVRSLVVSVVFAIAAAVVLTVGGKPGIALGCMLAAGLVAMKHTKLFTHENAVSANKDAEKELPV